MNHVFSCSVVLFAIRFGYWNYCYWSNLHMMNESNEDFRSLRAVSMNWMREFFFCFLFVQLKQMNLISLHVITSTSVFPLVFFFVLFLSLVISKCNKRKSLFVSSRRIDDGKQHTLAVVKKSTTSIGLFLLLLFLLLLFLPSFFPFLEKKTLASYSRV